MCAHTPCAPNRKRGPNLERVSTEVHPPPFFSPDSPLSSVDFPTRVARFPLFRPALAALLLVSLLALAAHLAPAQTDTASAREPAAPPQQDNGNNNGNPGGNGGDPGDGEDGGDGDEGGAGAAAAGGQSDNGGATASSGGATQADYSAFANQTTYPPGLGECRDLALEMYIGRIGGERTAVFQVGNRADETLTNVMVEIRFETPREDDYTSPPGATYLPYTENGIIFLSQDRPFWVSYGRASFDKPDPNDGRTYATRWQMPTIRPAASHSLEARVNHQLGVSSVRMQRLRATMTQLAPDGTALCKTERVYWVRGYGNVLGTLDPRYGVALSADERYPAAGDTVNFKVRVNARYAYGVNARVEHTSGLTLASTPSAPAKTEWKNYSAAKGKGDFWIGTESVRILSNVPTPIYEITLPMRLKSGATPSEQCVTVTVTGVPEPGPRVLDGQTGDDPSDNTETLCLGQPPLFDEDGDDVALWSLHPCVGTGATAHPCDNSDTLEVASVDNATGGVMSAEPDEVNAVIKLDPVAGATVDTHWGSVHTYRDQNNAWQQNPGKVSWVTKRTCPLNDHGHCESNNHQIVPGTAIGLSFVPFSGEFSNWDQFGRLVSVSGVGAGGLSSMPAQYGSVCTTPNNSVIRANLPTLPDAPGAMVVRWMSNGNWHINLRPVTANDPWSGKPRYKYGGWDVTSRSDTEMLRHFAEFTNLGTYVVDYHASLNRTSTATYKPGLTFCDTMRTVFHVGPIAELAVSDGGASPDVNSNQVAFTLNLSNNGPDESGPAKALVELPSGATSVTTIPANLGTFHAAGTVGGVSHGPYWLWNVGAIPTADTHRALRRPQGREITLVVSGVTVGETATATISNGNGHCEIGTTTLPFAIRTEDCAALNGDTSSGTTTSTTTAEWKLDNPYNICLNYDTTTAAVSEVSPKPSGKTACESTTGNSWHEGTVLDHHQANNTTTLTARSGGAGLSGAPGSETVTSAYLTLNWPSVTDAGEYRVFRSTDGMADSYARIARVAAPATTYIDDAVTDGTKYYYIVEALYSNRRLAEIYTTSATATTKPKASMSPGSVRSLRAARQADDENTIDISWRAPSNATAATRYDLQYRSRGYASTTYDGWATSSTEQTETTYTFSNAGGGTSYQFRVRAVNLVGDDTHPGSWSGAATVRPVSNPDQVGNLRATRLFTDETKINVSWTAPSGGTTPTSYQVQYKENAGRWSGTTTDVTGTTTHTFSDVKGASSYQFRVRAVTVTGGDTIYGSWRSSNTVQRIAAPGQVGNLRATRNATNDTIIKVTWTAPSNATGATRYDVEYKRDSEDWTSETTGLNTTTYQFGSATGASRYVFRVRGVTTLSGGERLEGSWRSSNAVPVLPAPNRVGSVTATRDTGDENRIVVSWNAPSGGTTPTGYEIQYKENNAGDWQPETPTDVTGTTTYAFTQANGGSRYQFQVRAYTTLNSGTKLRGGWRSSNNVAGLPAGNIANVTSTRSLTDPTTIDVIWDESARATVGYQVQFRKNNGGWTNATTTTLRTHTQTGAGGVETYTFRVRGISGAGNGAWTESNQVGPPPLGNHGYEFGVDWVTLKMTSGPWWYKYLSPDGWTSCAKVASGSHTVLNLRAEWQYTVDIYGSSACSPNQDHIARHNFTTLSDINNPDKCWNATDCRDIDKPNDFNNHTHKRQDLAAFGVTISGCDWSTRVQHRHAWPDGNSGQHWHCRQ